MTFVDNNGVAQPTHALSGDDRGCPHPNPDHSYNGGRVEYDNRQMDGFLRAGTNEVYSIGYYGEADIPFYAALRRNYTTCDRYFAAILGPTVSFVDPKYTILDDETGNDDHPHADIREGDKFLYQTFQAVANGPKGKHRAHCGF